jgi:hypothetical protein
LTDINTAGLNAIKWGVLRQYPESSIEVKECDLTDDGDVRNLLDFAAEKQICFDMLLNVAGVDFEGGFMDRDSNQMLKIVRLNVEATLRITHEILARRSLDKKFFLVFVSSLASLYPMPLKATYAASKRFLLDFSIALGEELKLQNVSVLSLCPGGLPTTEGAICGIAAQGFWGDATTNRLEVVAAMTISKVLQGKKIYIPGATNKIFSVLGKFIPNTLIAKLLYNRWSRAQSHWLSVKPEDTGVNIVSP